MYTNSKLAKSIRLVLMYGATATAFGGASAAVAQDSSESAERTERIQVTGSRIQRTDMEGAMPVTVIDREDIDMSGETSVADLLRGTTFNSAGSFRPRSGSSAQGVSSVDMRGLGSSRTLVLVDGRRLTMSPSTGSSQDLNSIPMAAVERIEILSDGASAVYGSDAIGGVINVITRRDFNGAELTVGASEVSLPKEGGDRDNGSAVFGSASDTTSVIGGVSWNSRDIIYERDFPWVTPGSSSYGNNFRTVDDPTLRAVPGGCAEENFISTEINDLDRCQYNFNATNANEASTGNESLFVKVQHDINADWTLYSNASIAKTSSFGRYAPAPDSNRFYPGLETPADSYNNPTNPDAWMYDANNPNAVDYDAEAVGPQQDIFFNHRFAAMGNRDTTVDNENVDFLMGVEGYIGNISVDFGARRVRNKTTEIGNGYLAANTAWGNVNDFNPGYDADGNFDPANRTGYDIQNPSDNPDAVLSAGVVTTSRISSFDIDELYASSGFDLFEMAGGLAQAAVGVEYREERYLDQYDSQSEAGLVGGSSGNSAGGGRDVFAAYAEMVMPVTYDLEVTLAGRFDDYSDYGSDFSPKVGVQYTPVDELMFRASYGLGFRAPTLDILTQKDAYSADSVTDAATCTVLTGDPEEPCQIDAYRLANPELESEESEQFSLGVVYQATDWLNLSVDYYNIEISDRIAFFGSNELIRRESAGDTIPQGLGVQRVEEGNLDSRIQRINTGYGNEGTLETSGLDLNIQTTFDFGEYGILSQNIQWAHVLDYTVDNERDLVGDPSRPENRINVSNQYKYGDFDFTWNINMIGHVAEEVDEGQQIGHVGSWTTHDLQVSYNTAWDGRISVGMQNAFEKTPELIPYDGRDYNFDLYNAFGRVTYVRYTQRF
ncbi:TonB-dependent receptor plug domain-containing protein [Aliidiomarina sp. Khilg15.8]